MLTVLPVNSADELCKIFNKSGFEYNQTSGCVVAKNGSEVLGKCLYYITDDRIIVLLLEPLDDIMLADGILRSALHVADFRGITDAVYADTAPVQLFKTLGFIKNSTEKSLLIEKLHESCCNCEKSDK